jgi:ABC-2 type transport system permease protein
MTLWRLEWLRLVRTKRLVALVGVYVFFGILGPFTARYLGEIVDRFGGEVTVVFPDPVPPDGIAQYVANASQIAVLVAIAVAAGALTIDAVPEMSVFLRTRVPAASGIVVPRFVVAALAACGAYLLGVVAAWYETQVLLGSVSAGGMLAGIGYAFIYLGFAVALVAAVGTRVRSVVGTVGIAVVALLLLPVIGIADAVGRWLPSHLVGAQVDLLRDSPATDYLGAAAVTVAAAAVLLVLAVRTAASREL